MLTVLQACLFVFAVNALPIASFHVQVSKLRHTKTNMVLADYKEELAKNAAKLATRGSSLQIVLYFQKKSIGLITGLFLFQAKVFLR